jgi:hypothetical protein
MDAFTPQPTAARPPPPDSPPATRLLGIPPPPASLHHRRFFAPNPSGCPQAASARRQPCPTTRCSRAKLPEMKAQISRRLIMRRRASRPNRPLSHSSNGQAVSEMRGKVARYLHWGVATHDSMATATMLHCSGGPRPHSCSATRKNDSGPAICTRGPSAPLWTDGALLRPAEI